MPRSVSIQVAPAAAIVKANTLQAFQAFVAGTFNKAVTWGTAAGSVDVNGVLTAPTGSGGIYAVTATSVADALLRRRPDSSISLGPIAIATVRPSPCFRMALRSGVSAVV